MSRLQVSISRQDIECPVTLKIFFDPVVTVCKHYVERAVSIKLQECPVCRKAAPQFKNVDYFFKNTLQDAIKQNKLYEEVYFNLEEFEKIVGGNKLDTPIGGLFITLLQNATTHLNCKEDIAIKQPDNTTTVINSNAVAILASTLSGRDLLRKKLHIDAASGKYFFGDAEISAESLQIQVNGTSIHKWLSMTAKMELMQETEQKTRTQINTETQTTYHQLQTQFSQVRLFLLRSAQRAATTGQRMPSDTVNPILQQVVYGNENAVRVALEAVKDNPAHLPELLSDTATVTDYSDRTITGMTLLQAAAAAGDIDMCMMLKNYMPQTEFETQLVEIFPKGIEAHEREQQRNAFDFNEIFMAIRAANTPHLDAALNKTNNGSALCRALEKFRHQFSKISHHEKIFNPHHLLRALEMHKVLCNHCVGNSGDDPRYQKRNLFWNQIIGYTQRFMPACYAQAFSQGLYYLVKVNQLNSWSPEAFKRNLKLRRNNCNYFQRLSDFQRIEIGSDFAVDVTEGSRGNGYGGVDDDCARTQLITFLKTFVNQKYQNLRILYCERETCRTASPMI